VSVPGFPNFPDKHGHDAIISPSEQVARFLENSNLNVPEAAILTYQNLIPGYLAEHGFSPFDGFPGPWRTLWQPTDGHGPSIGIANGFGFGAPAAAKVLEDLIALGVQRFISIGAAGCLDPDIGFGDIVVCSSAIRDEGLSHHYLPSEKFSYPSPELTTRLAEVLSERSVPHHSGPTWTVDTPYRETVAEARSYQAEGVLTVEMEAAGLFAVADYRSVEIASAFIVSDHLLAGERWSHAFGSIELRRGSIDLLESCLALLS
jgi:uridine phosphorylase